MNADMTVVYSNGLYEIRFGDYGSARENLAFLGWVETSRSTPAKSREPSEVRFFNRLVGGDGKLFLGDDGWIFLAPDGWLSKVYKKLSATGVITSPSEDARRRNVEVAAGQESGSVLDLFGE